MSARLSRIAVIAAFGLSMLAVPRTSLAGPAFFTYARTDQQVALGAHAALAPGKKPALSEVISIPGASWIRLRFSDYHLGPGSYVTITSLGDGGDQRLDARSMQNYRKHTAIFNGDAVLVELTQGPGDDDALVQIDEVVHGGPAGNQGDDDNTTDAICGTDERLATTDAAVGRFVFFLAGTNRAALCSSWITSVGVQLTAGHCIDRGEGDPDLMEFDVPLSSPGAVPNFADPDDQYPIDQNSFAKQENGTGQDWGVFDCLPNSDTGLLPEHARNKFYRMSKDSSPASVRVTGYGVDDGTANRTLQTDWGDYLGENGSGNDVDHEYIVDTMSGNSGGPVIVLNTSYTIGIHAHAGCNPPTEGNHGTSFENDDLEAALDDFYGTSTLFADVGHPISSGLENGTVFRPYDTVTEATSLVPNNGTVVITEGSYTKANNTFLLGEDGRSMTLLAPVGTATIGN